MQSRTSRKSWKQHATRGKRRRQALASAEKAAERLNSGDTGKRRAQRQGDPRARKKNNASY